MLRDRERDKDRQRDRERTEGDRERESSIREPRRKEKIPKAEREHLNPTNQPHSSLTASKFVVSADHFTQNPSGGPPSKPTSTPGPASVHHTLNSHPNTSTPPLPTTHTPRPLVPGPQPPPSAVQPYSPATNETISGGSNPLSDLEPDQVPPELKKEGSDWWAIFSPNVPRVLDVSLSLTLTHERSAYQFPLVLLIFT